jgi:hypothetical protein
VSGPKKLRHGDLEHGTAGEWLPPQCVRKSQRERLTTDRHHRGMASATGPDHRVGSPEEEMRVTVQVLRAL